MSLVDVNQLLEEAAPRNDSNYVSEQQFNTIVDKASVDLNWLHDACGSIIKKSTSQLPCDELAMAICRVLDSHKPGDEIAGDLLDLVGDNAFETVQHLLQHRKQLVESYRHGLAVLKSDKMASNNQPRMPSYGT
ncbi:unnamed protein product [Rhodiola kirilowii]